MSHTAQKTETLDPARARFDVLLPKGTTTGRYVLLDVLGAGGMGVVYSAYDGQLDRKVAIKVLRSAGMGGASPDVSARLLREAQAMARLSHPNVVAVHDVGVFGESVFLAMEYVEGGTLRDWLKVERTLRERVQVLVAAGRGLAAAHRAGIVHRDFKPENVLVGADGRVRVTDFGIARSEEGAGAPAEPVARVASGAEPAPGEAREGAAITEPGGILGTVGYMAPEQVTGLRADARSDQFAFCVTLHLALYGIKPFPAANLNEYVAAAGGPVVAPPKDARVPARVRRVILRGLRDAAEERYPSMDDLLAELEEDPAALWRRAASILALFAVLALVAALWIRPRAEASAELCTGAGAKLAGTWDGARRAEVARALEAAGGDSGGSTWKSVEAAIDDYTRAWTAMHADACRATRVRGEQSEELLDLRMQCLDDRLHEVGALVDALAKSDADVAERAPQAARSLTPIASCADVAALTAPVRLPKSPETASRVAAVRALIAKGTTENLLGRYDEAHILADRAVQDATAIGYAPALAEALRLLGEAQIWRGAYAEGREALVRAGAAAIEGRETSVEARALALLVLAAAREARFEEGHAWAALGEAAAKQAGLFEQGELAEEVGQLLYAERKLPEARAEVLRAIDAWERALGKADIRLADPLTDLANVDLALGRYADARVMNERAIAIVEAIVPGSPLTASNVNNVGDACLKSADYACAIDAFERADALYTRAYGPDTLGAAVARANLAEAWRGKGEPDRALPLVLGTAAVLEKQYPDGGPYMGAVLDGLGETYRMKGDTTRAVATFERALALRERTLGADHPEVAESLTGLGETLLDAGNAARARVVLTRALAIREAHAGDPFDVGTTRFALARALLALAAPATRSKALALAEAAQRDLAQAGPRGEKRAAEVARWIAGHS